MELSDLKKMNNEDRIQMRTEMLEAIAEYRSTMISQDSTRDEIRAAANNAIWKAAALIDLQTDLINALILSGRYMGELLTDNYPHLKN